MISLIYCKTHFSYLVIFCLAYDQTLLKSFKMISNLNIFFVFRKDNYACVLKISITYSKTRVSLLIAYLQDQQPKCYLEKVNIF